MRGPPYKVLKQSCSEGFSRDTNLVRVARKEYFKKHSPNFTTDGTHDLSEIFRHMAKSTKLLGSAIYKIQEVWKGPDKLQQANYTLCHFNGLTHCPWCGKEGQNEGTVVNHLWMVHYRLGLVCNKCYYYPLTSSDILDQHGWQNCLPSGEGEPDESALSE